MVRFLSLIGCAAVGWIAVAAAAMSAEDHMPLTLNDRTVDLRPYFYAFPYRIVGADFPGRQLFYRRLMPSGASHLFVTSFDPEGGGGIDLSKGRRFTGVDLDKINFWGREFNRALEGLIVRADNDKRERMNLWLFREGNAAPLRLTDVDYVYRFSMADDHRRVFFTARYGPSDDATGCLEVLEIENRVTYHTRKLVCDDAGHFPAKLNSWGPIRVDDQKVVLTAYAEGDRNKPELYGYDLKTGTSRRLVSAHGSSSLWVVPEWHDGPDFLYVRDKDLYYFDWRKKEARKLASFEPKISEVGIVKAGGRPYVVVFSRDILKTRIKAFRLDAGKLVQTDKMETALNPWVEENGKYALIVGGTSATTLVSYELYTFSADGKMRRTALFPDLHRLNDELSGCHVELTDYPSDDHSRETPGKGSIKAYLYTPKAPVPENRRLYVIEAFYGGRNGYHSFFQVLCKAGVTVLSPAVRGDARFGDAFEQANDRERADAPIRDVIAGARFLVRRFGIKQPRQIGTMGYSHGGWAAVRALTYPGPERFPFGFAIAGAGYFDFPNIVRSGTNIRGWIAKEFGDPETQQALLRRLSPAYAIDRIDAPIFLYHGENDHRISVDYSRAFAAQLKAAGKPYVLKVIKGQGHRMSGAANWYAVDKAIFAFLDGLNRPRH